MSNLTLPNNRASAEAMAQVINKEIEEGLVDPLQLLIARKSIETFLELIKPTLNAAAITEAAKHGSGLVKYQGAEIKVGEYGTQYDYSKCNDPVYEEILERFNKVDKEKKSRETFLKGLTKMEQIMDAEGTLHEVWAPVKTSTTVPTVKL